MRHKSKQQGSMLVISVFVILVMTLLGLAMTQLLSTSANTIVFEVGGARALNAARSGLNEQLTLQFPLGQDALLTCNAPSGPQAFNNGVTGLKDCDYEISCSCSTHTFEGQKNVYFRISSVGTCSMGDVNMSRTIAIESRVLPASNLATTCN